MFSQVFVCPRDWGLSMMPLPVWLPGPMFLLWEGFSGIMFLVGGGSLQGGFLSRGGSAQGGLYLEGPLYRRSLYRGDLYPRRLSVQGGSL